MGNIFDYLLWRGDLNFDSSPFNEIDNLICSRISYFPMEMILKKNEKITIKNLYKSLIKYKNKFKKEEDIKLLELLKVKMDLAQEEIISFINKYVNNLNSNELPNIAR